LLLSVQADLMVNRFILLLVALFFMAVPVPAGQSKPTILESWSGIVVSSACNADEVFNESPECTKEVRGAKPALYDDTNRVMYRLEPQSSLTAHVGDAVTVRGTLDGETSAT
jgi:nitrogen fixation protein FixH